MGGPKLVEAVVEYGGSSYLVQSTAFQERSARASLGHHMLLIDVLLSVKPCTDGQVAPQKEQKSTALQNFLSASIGPYAESWSGIVRMGLSTVSGYAIRSNCFKQRFVHCQHLGMLLDNTIAGQFFPAINVTSNVSDINSLFRSCPFMFLAPGQDDEARDALSEIDARVSFAWLSDSPAPLRKTMVLVHGRDNFHHFQLIHESASDLNIGLVIIDTDGHWLQDPKYCQMYDRFIPLDMTIDDEFHLRIAKAVSSHGAVDGICTVSDRCLYPVARAAELLGLPTELPSAVQKSINKFETRRLDNISVSSTALVDSTAELKSALRSGEFQPQFPLIVKPSQGWGSELVFKVQNWQELYGAIDRTKDGFSKKVLVEAYLDGPELDVNFILHQGRILFFEIADDFPSTADLSGNPNDDFYENSNILPSALPVYEYECVKAAMYALLTRLGFHTGIFHVEAKIQGSSMAYQTEGGCMDLRKSSQSNHREQPRCCVIEVNPRPPGFPCGFATRASYGVNVFDAHLLASLRDERLQMLVQPFKKSALLENHARLWTQLVWVKADHSGICASKDSCQEFIRDNPDLRDKVVEARCFYKKGDIIPMTKPGVPLFGAFFVVASSESRDEVVRLGQILRDRFHIAVVN